jgi:hypothetical protein
MTDAELLAAADGRSDRESDDERAERITIERLADASGVVGVLRTNDDR